MTAHTLRFGSPQSHLRSKRAQRELSLVPLYRPEPGTGARQNVIDRLRPLGEPSKVIRIPVPFDSAQTTEDLLQSSEHLRWHPYLAMLRCRHAEPVPVGTTFPRTRVISTKASLGIQESGGPSPLNLVGTRARGVRGRMHEVIVGPAARRSRLETTASITVEYFLESRGRLRPLYRTQVAPQQRDRGLCLLEAPRLPHIDPVFVRTDDLPHSEHRTLETIQDLGNLAMTPLGDGGLHSDIATFLVRGVGDRGTLAVEESGGPCDLQRIERT
jgi:hypothetical protein